MAAYAEVVQGEVRHASLGVESRPVIRSDYTTNGHVVLWAESFNRFVDPTIAQHPALLAEAHRGEEVHGAPLSIPIPGGREVLLRGAIGAIRTPFQINYLVQPQYTSVFDPWLDEFRDGLDHGALGLAHLTLECIAAVGGERNLRALPHQYPQLGALLAGRKELPVLPEIPPESWTRLNGLSGSRTTS